MSALAIVSPSIVSPVVTATIVQPVKVGATMAALKAELPDYFQAPSLETTLSDLLDKNRAFAPIARAVTRAALVAAHSGSVDPALTRIIATLGADAVKAKGATKKRLNHLYSAYTFAQVKITELKNAHKGASLDVFIDVAIALEAEFVAAFTPPVVVKAAKPVAETTSSEDTIESAAETASSEDTAEPTQPTDDALNAVIACLPSLTQAQLKALISAANALVAAPL